MRYFAQIVGDLVIIVAIGAPCGLIAIIWDKMPWFEKYIRPRKMAAGDRDQIKAFKTHESCPAAFDPANSLFVAREVPPSLRPEDVEAIAVAVFAKIKEKP